MKKWEILKNQVDEILTKTRMAGKYRIEHHNGEHGISIKGIEFWSGGIMKKILALTDDDRSAVTAITTPEAHIYLWPRRGA